MPKRAPIPTDWFGRLKAELVRDKKKTGILVALVLVAAIVVARVALSRSGPAAAVAEVPTPQAAPGYPSGSPGGEAVSPLGKSPRPDRAKWAEYLRSMDRTISRNLFRPNLACFPPQPGAKVEPDPGLVGEPGWFERVRNGIAERQQEGSTERARIRAITAQARSLKLQSTMRVGNSPTALIDGQVLREGDYVSGFRVKRIASNRCVVTKDGVDVELRMEP